MQKNFDIRNYIWNIFELSNSNKIKNLNLAFDLFTTNLYLGCERYKGITSINYKKISKIWNNLSESDKIYEKIIFRRTLNYFYDDLCKEWKNKNNKKFNYICKSIYR